MAAISIVLLSAIFILHFKTVFLFGLFSAQWQGAGDAALLYLPSRFFFGNSLHIGEFPLWNNNMFLGFPIHAEGQGGFFYPLNILFAVFPSWVAYNYVFIAHIFLGGFFTYLFAREIKLKKIPSVLAAFIFAFSGFFACHAEHMNLLNACVWIPLGFLFILRKRYLCLSLIFALQFLTGFPQIAFYTGIILFFWTVFNIKNVKEIISFLVSLILGCLVACCQVLPTLELIPYSVRSKGVAVHDMYSWGYYLKDLLLFFSPYAFGNPALGTYARSDSILYENCAFVGIMAILLVVAGLIKNKRGKSVGFFLILSPALLAFLLAFPAMQSFAKHIPVFNFFRLPQRFLVFVVFSFAIISGFGFQSLKKFRFPVFFVVFLELAVFSLGYNNVVDMDYFSAPPVAKFLKQDKENPRVLVIDAGQKAGIRNYVFSTQPGLNYFSQRVYLNYLPPNTGVYFNISTLNTYSPLSVVTEPELQELAGENAKYILSTVDLNNKNLSLVKEYGMLLGFPAVKIYRNGDYISRAFFRDKNIRKPFALEIEKSGAQKVEIKKNIKAAGEVVLTDFNYPGWSVFIDGVKSKINTSGSLTRSVAVDAGSKNIIFIFMPLSFAAGLMITVVSIFVLSGLLIYGKNTCH